MQSTERAITGSVTTTRLYTYDAKAATNHMYIMGYTKAAFMYAKFQFHVIFMHEILILFLPLKI